MVTKDLQTLNLKFDQAPPSIQMYCAMTDGLACCAYDMTHVPRTRLRPRGKKSMTGERGAINRAASPAASLPPRHWFRLIQKYPQPGN